MGNTTSTTLDDEFFELEWTNRLLLQRDDIHPTDRALMLKEIQDIQKARQIIRDREDTIKLTELVKTKHDLEAKIKEKLYRYGAD